MTNSPVIHAKSINYDRIGRILLLAFLVQALVGLRWDGLALLQGIEAYKQISGYGLLTLIGLQWRMALVKSSGRPFNMPFLKTVHQCQGAAARVLLYAHATTLGHGYQSLLVMSLLGTVAGGLFRPDAIHYHKRWYVIGWLVTHVNLAVLCLALTFFHIFIVYSYH